MIVEIVPVFHVQNTKEFFEHKSEFKMEEREVKCDHCSHGFETWADVIFTNTFCICKCPLRLCKECNNKEYERKTLHSNS